MEVHMLPASGKIEKVFNPWQPTGLGAINSKGLWIIGNPALQLRFHLIWFCCRCLCALLLPVYLSFDNNIKPDGRILQKTLAHTAFREFRFELFCQVVSGLNRRWQLRCRWSPAFWMLPAMRKWSFHIPENRSDWYCLLCRHCWSLSWGQMEGSL